MKHLYVITVMIVGILSTSLISNAQGIYQFWGIADNGGNNDQGTLFSARFDGTGVRTRKAFEIYTPGEQNAGLTPTPYNGKLYGMMPKAGPYSAGIIYEYDPVANTYTTKAELYTIDKYPNFDVIGNLIVHNNKLYGLLQDYSHTDKGVLIEFDPATGSLVKKYEFINGTGALPVTSLTLYNNKLYGATYNGGVFNYGVIYSYDLATNTYAVLADLKETTGIKVINKLVVYNNRLYGTTGYGGLNNQGTVFELNLANNVLTKRADFATLGGVGEPGGLTLLNNKLYGGSSLGGTDNKGILYEFDPAGNTLQKKVDLTSSTGCQIHGDLITHNNKLYGLTLIGGVDNDGVLFEYDPATNTWLKKVNLSISMGSLPYGSLAFLNNRMYGFTSRGGINGKGVLFEYNPVINGYTKKVELGRNNGINPLGKLTYYSGKLYGVTDWGGNEGSGVIYSYDLATHTYAIRHHLTYATGHVYDQGGMVLYNNKLYGVGIFGGDNFAGVLYEFDPLNDTYTIKHSFATAQGKYPSGLPVIHNGKLYGTTKEGGDNGAGVLYEYDLASNTYAVKVHLGGSFGSKPIAGLTVYNAKLYGTTSEGGTYNGGTLFEYISAGNGFVKRHDFELATGIEPGSAMVVHNGMLYGTTIKGGATEYGGTIFSFNPANNTYSKRHEFLYPGVREPRSDLAVLNNKLYGMCSQGGEAGVLYEYDPATGAYSNKTEFNGLNGRAPRFTRLTAVPALVAPGTTGACQPGVAVDINSSNNNQWVPVTDEDGNAIAEIKANGNNLGAVTISFYTQNGNARQDAAGRFYLNRNITITPDKQPVTPVSVRLYIRKAEFESLKGTPGSGILNVNDLTIFESTSSCGNAITSTALPSTSTVTTWGFDYVYTAQINSFSSFYFASKTYTALPIDLEYFKGSMETAGNRLQWKANCTGNADFIIERSADGVYFSQIGLVMATSTDCAYPFQFIDKSPLSGKQYYRLQMKEVNAQPVYSPVIKLERKGDALNIQLTGNPISGNSVVFDIYTPTDLLLPFMVYDVTGKVMLTTQLQLLKGAQTKTINFTQLPAGIYQAVFHVPGNIQTVRFMRK